LAKINELLLSASKKLAALESATAKANATDDVHKKAKAFHDSVFTAQADLRKDIDALESLLPRRFLAGADIPGDAVRPLIDSLVFFKEKPRPHRRGFSFRNYSGGGLAFGPWVDKGMQAVGALFKKRAPRERRPRSL
jgi:hypothetical protein